MIMEQGRGNHFDPFLFGVFLSLVPEMRRIAAENPDEQVEEYARRGSPMGPTPMPGVSLPVMVSPVLGQG